MNMKRDHKVFIVVFTAVAAILLFIGGAVRIIDPFVHYSGGLSGVTYYYPDEYARFINDGISRNYDYDALITGTSLTQCFKSSEMDELFDAKTIKLTAQGAGWKEIDALVRNSLAYNPNLKYVVRGIDLSSAAFDKDFESYEGLPDYMADKNVINDLNYLFDKRAIETCLTDISYTVSGKKGTDMDSFGYWGDDYEYGLFAYYFDESPHEQAVITDEQRQTILDNIHQNMTSVADEHPDVSFYYFITPYSICVFDGIEADRFLDVTLEAERMIIEECNKHPNIEIYSFLDREDIICDLSLYKDTAHYSPEVCSYILKCMKDKTGRITPENRDAYYERVLKVMEEIR